LTTEVTISHWAVKEAVFPFDRFEKVDTLLGPEMKSTGEVMGIDDNLGLAIAKSQLAAGSKVPLFGNVFISVRDSDKETIVTVGKELVAMKYTIFATDGTAHCLRQAGVACLLVNKISQGRPHILDKIRDGEISWIINTSLGKRTTEDSYSIRRAALDYHIPYNTTASGAVALVKGMREMQKKQPEVQPVQYFTRPRG
jgi:carbamoyl-phosphate synthase large subunit